MTTGRAGRLFERALRALAYCGGAALLALMGLILFDVLMRYVLKLPFLGGFELTELAMVLIVALGLPYCAATDGHVSVDVLSPLLDRPALRWIPVVLNLVGAALVAVMAWESTRYAIGSVERGEATNMLGIPIYPFQLVIAVGMAMFALVLLVLAWRAARPVDRSEARR
jgi:TRAP-type C4-dicarboxylate transport system permease small subunit